MSRGPGLGAAGATGDEWRVQKPPSRAITQNTLGRSNGGGGAGVGGRTRGANPCAGCGPGQTEEARGRLAHSRCRRQQRAGKRRGGLGAIQPGLWRPRVSENFRAPVLHGGVVTLVRLRGK